jgi:hypothetical protein
VSSHNDYHVLFVEAELIFKEIVQVVRKNVKAWKFMVRAFGFRAFYFVPVLVSADLTSIFAIYTSPPSKIVQAKVDSVL